MSISFQVALLVKDPPTWLVGKSGQHGADTTCMSLHIHGFCCHVITNWYYRAWFSGEGNQAAVPVWLVMGCMVNMAPYRVGDGVCGQHGPR